MNFEVIPTTVFVKELKALTKKYPKLKEGIKDLGVMDKKNGILEMFCSSGQKEWCLFL